MLWRFIYAQAHNRAYNIICLRAIIYKPQKFDYKSNALRFFVSIKQIYIAWFCQTFGRYHRLYGYQHGQE